MRARCSGWFLLLASCVVSAAPATEESVRRLMALTGAGEMGVQVVHQMVPELKRILPEAPAQIWEEVVPIYQRHFSEEDVQAAIAYFSSPAGRRMVEKQGVVMQESFAAGQQWGSKLAERAIAKLRAQETKRADEGKPALDVETVPVEEAAGD
jgi:hypothetical protein